MTHGFRRLILALCLGAACAAPPAAAQDGAVTELSPEGLRSLAAARLQAGEAEEARTLALALLARDPGDALARLVLAEAEILRGDWPAAARAGGAAFRGLPPDRRYRAARIAAFAQAQQGHDTRAQIWLRRARQVAPSAAEAQAVARDYGALRARNPLSVDLSFGLAPTSNANAGTRTATIPIVLPGGTIADAELSADARALSGLEMTGLAALSYRLRQDRRSLTRADLQLYHRTYRLSAEAREAAPEASGGDYAVSVLSLGLLHRMRPEGWQSGIDLGVTGSRLWYGGEAYEDTLRFSLSKPLRLAPQTALTLTALMERRWRLTRDRTYWAYGAEARLTHALADRGTVTARLGLRDQDTAAPDTGYEGLTLGLGYAPGDPVFGARLALRAEAEWRDYDASLYGASRSDRRGALTLEAQLPRLETYGFVPLVTLEGERTRSEVPLFDRDSLRIGVDLRSAF
ncbi:hypothetical protein [Pseudoroseicyclus aestuarii]|uniref:Tetratricopeptide repeat protein n=1 Tax=Pseudoroseicyclus aestuarii TaxID=1795041 RepID=A0A318SUK1_9RHOB|nr:hypothetical protein [Pseudoroseicyclus aestuarii]PYE83926.1 hypothetical protein DFP88_103287 [Pseudoroseicyclus aestuarii]